MLGVHEFNSPVMFGRQHRQSFPASGSYNFSISSSTMFPAPLEGSVMRCPIKGACHSAMCAHHSFSPILRTDCDTREQQDILSSVGFI